MKKLFLYFIVLAVVILLIFGLVLLGIKYFKGKGENLPSYNKSQEGKQKEEKAARTEKQRAYIEIIKALFEKTSPGTTFSLAVYDIKHDEYFGYNDTVSQHAASVSKLLTAAYVFDQAEKGKVNLAAPMGDYNIETQIKYLINQSSEDSWGLLDGKFPPAAQNEFAKSLGMSATDISFGKNAMSAKDICTLLKKIAKGELLNEPSRSKLYSYMQNTESENFFSPAFILKKTAFYHKTGKYESEAHDAAIVEYKNPFVLVVFSNNNNSLDPNERGPILQKVASVILEYFEKV